MSANDIQEIIDITTRLDAAKPARFSFTQDAYDDDEIEGVDLFNIANAQNIPNASKVDYDPLVLDRGARTQGASIPRMAWNHFIGRFSYNIAKLTQKMLAFTQVMKAHIAHNASEYDATQTYAQNDVCYLLHTVDTVLVVEFYKRTSSSPLHITGVSPDAVGQTDWSAVSVNASLVNSKKPATAATANTVILRDANGRAQVASPAADADIATRGFARDAANLDTGLLALARLPTNLTEKNADLLDNRHGAAYVQNEAANILSMYKSNNKPAIKIDATDFGEIWADGNMLKGTNWFKLQNGFIVQGGGRDPVISGSTAQTFTVAFTTSVFFIGVTIYRGASAIARDIQTSSVTLNGFVIEPIRYDTGVPANLGANDRIYWFAFGY